MQFHGEWFRVGLHPQRCKRALGFVAVVIQASALVLCSACSAAGTVV